MIAIEKTLKTENIYSGSVLCFRVETVEVNGKIAFREMVSHPGGVGIVAMNMNSEVCMVRQFRKPYEKAILEIPAGKLDKGENPEAAALRELSEETGLTCGEKLISLGEFYPSVGYTNEIIHLYLAKNLTPGKSHPDDDEYVETEYIPISKLIDMIMSGEIKDGKTIAALLKTEKFLEK